MSIQALGGEGCHSLLWNALENHPPKKQSSLMFSDFYVCITIRFSFFREFIEKALVRTVQMRVRTPPQKQH